MEYFHLDIFVIPRECLNRKYGSQTQAIFFFAFHRFFDTVTSLYLVLLPENACYTARPVNVRLF